MRLAQEKGKNTEDPKQPVRSNSQDSRDHHNASQAAPIPPSPFPNKTPRLPHNRQKTTASNDNPSQTLNLQQASDSNEWRMQGQKASSRAHLSPPPKRPDFPIHSNNFSILNHAQEMPITITDQKTTATLADKEAEHQSTTATNSRASKRKYKQHERRKNISQSTTQINQHTQQLPPQASNSDNTFQITTFNCESNEASKRKPEYLSPDFVHPHLQIITKDNPFLSHQASTNTIIGSNKKKSKQNTSPSSSKAQNLDSCNIIPNNFQTKPPDPPPQGQQETTSHGSEHVLALEAEPLLGPGYQHSDTDSEEVEASAVRIAGTTMQATKVINHSAKGTKTTFLRRGSGVRMQATPKLSLQGNMNPTNKQKEQSTLHNAGKQAEKSSLIHGMVAPTTSQ